MTITHNMPQIELKIATFGSYFKSEFPLTALESHIQIRRLWLEGRVCSSLRRPQGFRQMGTLRRPQASVEHNV